MLLLQDRDRPQPDHVPEGVHTAIWRPSVLIGVVRREEATPVPRAQLPHRQSGQPADVLFAKGADNAFGPAHIVSTSSGRHHRTAEPQVGTGFPAMQAPASHRVPSVHATGGGATWIEPPTERKSVVWGKSVSVRVDLGGRR